MVAILLLLAAPSQVQGAASAERVALEAAAKKGNAQAQYDLALELMYGEDVDPKTRDAAAAMGWLRRAAEQGHLEAQKDLGTNYSLGIGVAPDAAEAAHWYSKAADQGDAEARFYLAVAYEQGEGVKADSAAALRLHRLAAAQGYASSQAELGEIYLNGLLVPRDDLEAVRWLRLAADQGQPEGQVTLREMLVAGRGVARNEPEANQWFRKAAERGYPRGMGKLGESYALGRGAARNAVCAYLWYGLAAKEGWILGERRRAALAATLSADELVYGSRLIAESAVKPGNVDHPCCPGDLVTFSLKDAALGDVIASIGTLSGLKIAGDFDAAASVRVKLEDRPWEEILTYILHSVGLAWRRNGDTILVSRAGAG
ncbi:MAG: hypothetical protein ABI639_00145 [Thermoanaerobaculia bacterium]